MNEFEKEVWSIVSGLPFNRLKQLANEIELAYGHDSGNVLIIKYINNCINKLLGVN